MQLKGSLVSEVHCGVMVFESLLLFCNSHQTYSPYKAQENERTAAELSIIHLKGANPYKLINNFLL